ncbi:MAG TPA: hypothetical protein VLF62_04545 [Candidatus Saccharimonadales bacterium]|nr:hypothetical protein [Candidatus Saccharimonadales bacterium]
MASPESVPAAPQSPAELLVARLPELEQRITALTPTDAAGNWQPTDKDGVIGIVHARGTVDGMDALVTASRWYGRDPDGEVVAAYSMRPLNNSPFIMWPQGARAPEDVHFKRHSGRHRVIRPDFARALLIADVVMAAEPLEELPVSPVMPASRMLRALGGAWARGVELWGEVNDRPGHWPYHP